MEGLLCSAGSHIWLWERGDEYGTSWRINQSQTSWVLSPLEEGGAHRSRMLCHQTGEKNWGQFLYPRMGVAPTITQDLEKGGGISFSIKI